MMKRPLLSLLLLLCALPAFAATETFTAANGTALTALPTGYVTVFTDGGTPTVQSNSLENTAALAGIYTARVPGTFANNQSCQFTVTTNSGTGGIIGCTVRTSAVAQTHVTLMVWPGHSFAQLRQTVAGTETTLATGSLTAVVSDVIKLDVSGTTYTSTRNASTTNMPTATSDATIASGAPGIYMYGLGAVGSNLDDFVYTDPTSSSKVAIFRRRH